MNPVQARPQQEQGIVKRVVACVMALAMVLTMTPALAALGTGQGVAYGDGAGASTATVYKQSDGYQPYQGWQSAPWDEGKDPWYSSSGGTTRKGYPAWSLVTPMSKGVTAYSGNQLNPITTGSEINVLTDFSGDKFSTDTSGAGTIDDPWYWKNIVLDSLDAAQEQKITFNYVGAGGANANYLFDGHGGIFFATSDDPSQWGERDSAGIFQPSDKVVWQASKGDTTISNTSDNWWKTITTTMPAGTLKAGQDYYLVVMSGTAGQWGRLFANIVFKVSTDTANPCTWEGRADQAGYGFEQGNGGVKVGIMNPKRSEVTTDLSKIDYAYFNTITSRVGLDEGTATFRVQADGSGSNWQTTAGWSASTCGGQMAVYTSDPTASGSYDDDGLTSIVSVGDGLSFGQVGDADFPSRDGVDIKLSGLSSDTTYYLVFRPEFRSQNATRAITKPIVIKFKTARSAIDKTTLSNSIADAQGLLDKTKVSADGTDVYASDLWATQGAIDTLKAAIGAAQKVVADAAATADAVASAVQAIDEAAQTFDGSRKLGSVDKAPLTKAIFKAQTLLDEVPVSVDGTDVSVNDVYVVQEVHDTFAAAIKAAQDVLAGTPSISKFGDAVKALGSAGEVFEAAKLQGKRNDPLHDPWEIGKDTAADVTATLYEDGTLKIEGTGDTQQFSGSGGPWCSQYRTTIKAVEFGEGVAPTNMDYWFSMCSSLKTVAAFPASATSMVQTFRNCSALEEAPAIPEGVTTIASAFYGCAALKALPEIPAQVETMTQAFYYCKAATTAGAIKTTVAKSIDSTYIYCSSLVEAPAIPEGVTSIRSAFQYCSSLEKAPVIPEGVENIAYAFQGCAKLAEAPVIPSTVTDMSTAFSGCTALAKAPVIPEGVTSMASAFYGCASLKAAALIPASVTTASYAFYGCTSLIVLPKGFTIAHVSSTGGMFNLAGGSAALKTYAAADADESVTGYGWANANRELVVLPEGSSPESINTLTEAVAAAKAAMEGIETSIDGKGLPVGTKYVTPEVASVVKAAQEKAASALAAFLEGTGSDEEALGIAYTLSFVSAQALTTVKTVPEPVVSQIVYHVDGNVVLGEAPTSYVEGTGVQLVAPTCDGRIFVSWFVDEGLTQGISAVDASASGTVELWAKWNDVVEVPTAVKGLTYTGKEQVGLKVGDGVCVEGGTAVYPGAHIAVATPAEGCAWADGSTAAKVVKFTIGKAAQKISAKGKLKAKASKKVKTIGSIKVSGAKGKLSYKKLSGSKALAVSKAGRVTVKRSAKKGTYTAKVKVVSGSSSYWSSTSKTVKVTVKLASKSKIVSFKVK